MRTVLFNMFRKETPFDGLIKHGEKVKEGVSKLGEAVKAYLGRDYVHFEDLTDEIKTLENDADIIKCGIRNNLPRGIFIPVEKSALLSLLKEQDSILDVCEDIVVWLQFRKSNPGPELKRSMLEYLEKVIDLAQNLEAMVKDMHRLITSMSPSERKRIKENIKSIHFSEDAIDRMERNIIRSIFDNENEMLYFYHIIHVVFLLGNIADHVENAGDNIRLMLAR